MFGVDSSELLIVAVVALLVIGPKDLPRVMRHVGQWVGRARGMARHFRSGFDTMMREAELEEMEKKWREENERIMREFPTSGDWAPVEALPAPENEPTASLPPSGPEPTVGEQDPQDELPLPEPPPPAETRRELP